MAISAEPVSEELLALGKFKYSDTPIMSYFEKNPGPVASASITDALQPQLEIIDDEWEGGVRTVELQLKSMRGARMLVLIISTNSGLLDVHVDKQQTVLEESPAWRGLSGGYYLIQVFT